MAYAKVTVTLNGMKSAYGAYYNSSNVRTAYSGQDSGFYKQCYIGSNFLITDASFKTDYGLPIKVYLNGTLVKTISDETQYETYGINYYFSVSAQSTLRVDATYDGPVEYDTHEVTIGGDGSVYSFSGAFYNRYGTRATYSNQSVGYYANVADDFNFYISNGSIANGYTFPIKVYLGSSLAKTIYESSYTTYGINYTYNGSSDRTIYVYASRTYYYRIRYLNSSGTSVAETSTQNDSDVGGYISVDPGDFSAPTGYSKTGSYTAIRGCRYNSTTGNFEITSASSTTYAIAGIYVSANKYTVTFNPNGGTVSQTTKQVTFNSNYGTLPTPVWSGHTFDGWFTDTTFSSQVQSGTVVSRAENHTLVAKWSVSSFTVSAEAGSGYESMFSDVSVDPTTVQSGGTATFSATLVSGYEFTGWYNGSGTLISSSNPYSPTITSNLTLYARAALSAFAWTYSHAAGTSSVSKAEWRRLQTFINRKRTAAGQSAYSFSAFKGYMTPLLFNEAAEAIGINDRVSHGEAIHRSHFTRLATAANNM